MKHIGILAHSADGAALCFLTMVRHAADLLGAHQHPEITLSILPMAPTLPAYDRGELHAVGQHLRHSCQRLAVAGCDFFVCPDNTGHLALEQVDLPLPGLHICDVVSGQARGQGYSCIGLLGTRWTMNGSAYRDAAARHGLTLLVPEAADAEFVQGVIFSELCQGQITDASRDGFIAIIRSLQQAGCDAVVLGCTEIPLLIGPEISPLPTLDSTRLLARAAVETALGHRPMPAWRGGRRGTGA